MYFEPWVSPLSILALFIGSGLAFRYGCRRYLRVLIENTESRLDDILLDSTCGLIPLWAILIGLYATIGVFPIAAGYQILFQRFALAGLFISFTIAAARIARRAIEEYSRHLGRAGIGTSLTSNLAQAVVLVIGGMLLLSNLGISITPLITALGVGSLAVALALQDTLSNLFAGIYIIMTQMVQVGDYIRLDSGHEGIVVDIGWRTTKIRELANNNVLVPNSKLSQSIVVNYNTPNPQLGFGITLGVAYGSDLDRAERAIEAVALEIQKTVQGAVRDFEPNARFFRFGESSIDLTVGLKADNFGDRGLLAHEFIKRCSARLAKEGIVIPFPTRVVHSENSQKA